MAKPMEQYKWHELNVGCVIEEVGNASEYKTGDWRSQKPVVNQDKCIKCGLCWLFCPDVAIEQTEDGRYRWNLDYCKGCGICATECKPGAIKMVEEER
ncbi:MAG TPA: pyruvate synthase subunit PorD [Syntrophorhabdus aromaticivorans]|nr:pyruvate synthase subunit PorD [Syntrophorhabdus aromaticivorans]